MGTSQAKKEADYRWKRKNMHNFTVQMTNRDADALKAACAASGVTPHSVFLAAARAYIAAHPVDGAPNGDSGGDAVRGPDSDA